MITFEDICHLYPDDYFSRRCYACESPLQFSPYATPSKSQEIWLITSQCLGCGNTLLCGDALHSENDACALALYLNTVMSNEKPPQAVLHWEKRAQKIRQRERQQLRRWVGSHFPTYRDCFPQDPSPLFVLPGINPNYPASLVLTQSQPEYTLTWGDHAWYHRRTHTTIRSLKRTLKEILTEQRVALSWFRNQQIYSIDHTLLGTPIPLPPWAPECEKVAIFSWRGTHDRILEHPQQTGGILSP